MNVRRGIRIQGKQINNKRVYTKVESMNHNRPVYPQQRKKGKKDVDCSLHAQHALQTT